MYHISIVTQHATRFWPELIIFVRRAHCTKFSAKDCFVREQKLIQTLQVSKSPYILTVE